MGNTDTEANPVPRLIICSSGSPIMIPLADEMTLGRDHHNQIQVDKNCISYDHLRITRTADGRYQITDWDTKNGTTVNGISIGSCLLNDGDCIVVGQVVTMYFLHLLPMPDEVIEPEVNKFVSIQDRIRILEREQRLLNRRLREKTTEYEELLDYIIEMKQNPEWAFRQIYGEEVHFPVNFADRMSIPATAGGRVTSDEEVALSS